MPVIVNKKMIMLTLKSEEMHLQLSQLSQLIDGAHARCIGHNRRAVWVEIHAKTVTAETINGWKGVKGADRILLLIAGKMIIGFWLVFVGLIRFFQ